MRVRYAHNVAPQITTPAAKKYRKYKTSTTSSPNCRSASKVEYAGTKSRSQATTATRRIANCSQYTAQYATKGIVNRYECAHPSGAISGMKARARSVTRSTSGDLKIRVKLNIASTATSTEAFSTLIHPGTSIFSHARRWSMGSDRRTTVAVMDWLDKALSDLPAHNREKVQEILIIKHEGNQWKHSDR